ncbi:zinc finger protein 845-like [Aphis craccivora]|uniref:Zinc finger protein 845-like n=1 Tax=Aphis craccivora TaxID=307492 RepID=A0A6G0VZJ4_APHCR|nr:zinc finger protein 845-like [Aphis craccivora]
MMIFNRSFAIGVFPEKWKISYVSPVYKSGDINHVINYRTVSIITIIPKMGGTCLAQNRPFPFRPDTRFGQSHFSRFQIKLAIYNRKKSGKWVPLCCTLGAMWITKLMKNLNNLLGTLGKKILLTLQKYFFRKIEMFRCLYIAQKISKYFEI